MRALALLLCLATFSFLPFPATAAEPSAADALMIDDAVKDLDRTAALPGGEAAVLERIERDFAFPPGRIRLLRKQGAGYGEIVALLSFARTLPGGLLQPNIERVGALRKGPPARDWGRVAGEIGASPGEAASQVRQVLNEVRRLMDGAKGTKGGARKQWKKPDLSGEGKALPRGRAAD